MDAADDGRRRCCRRRYALAFGAACGERRARGAAHHGYLRRLPCSQRHRPELLQLLQLLYRREIRVSWPDSYTRRADRKLYSDAVDTQTRQAVEATVPTWPGDRL